MLKTAIFLSLFTIQLYPASMAATEPATKGDIRMLMELIQGEQRVAEMRFQQIEKRFEQVDKRFEQVDKRFEQVDKRFEFIQTLLLALFVASLGSPFLVERYRQRRDDHERKVIRGMDRMITAMREAANYDDKIKEILSSARLL
jgi:L-ribulose-5-phosphate 3-epimerase UlaE